MNSESKKKRTGSLVLIGILLGLIAAAGVIWLLFFYNKHYAPGVRASVDGTIRTGQQDAGEEFVNLSGCTPAAVISDGKGGGTKIGLTFVGLSEDAEANAAMVQLVKEHNLKATLALSAAEAVECEDTVQAFLEAGGEIISNGTSGEANLHTKPASEMLTIMVKSREAISAGLGQSIPLLYCSGTVLTSDVLCAARAGGYQAVVDPNPENVLDASSFSDPSLADRFVSGLSGNTIVVISLRGPRQSIQPEPSVSIGKPAIDKQPGLKDVPTTSQPGLTAQIQWLVDAMEAHALKTEYVSRFPLIDGLATLKERVLSVQPSLAFVYPSVLTDKPLVGIGISGLPAPEQINSTLTQLKSANATATFFISAQEAASRQADISALTAAGCSIGAAISDENFGTLSQDQVFDLLYKTLQPFAALPGYGKLILAEEAPAQNALRAAAAQLGVRLVNPENGEQPAPGSLYLLSGAEEIATLRKKAPRLEFRNMEAVIQSAVNIPALSSSEVRALREQNNGELSAVQKSMQTTARQIGLGFYGLNHPPVAADVTARLEARGATGTFFATLEELTTANSAVIESALAKGNELGIRYRVSSDYPQTFAAVASYIHSWKAYAQWRYGVSSDLVFLRLDTVEDETLEAIHACGCQVTVGSMHPLKKLDAEISLSALPQAADEVDALRIQRGAFVFFDLNYFTSDQHAQMGSTVLGAALERFFLDSVDAVAYRSQKTGEIEDDSRFAVTTLRALRNAPNQYSPSAQTQTDITVDKNILTSMATDTERFRYLSQRYYGNITVDNSQKLPGFSSNEVRALDKSGTFTEDPVLFLTFDDWGTEQSINPLLYVLEKHNVKATFFVRTNYVDGNPNLLRAIAQQGHQIASHTDTHAVLADTVDAKGNITASLSEEEAQALREELVTSYDKLYRYTGDVVVDGKPSLSRMFRPPTLAVSKIGLSQVFDVGFDYSISGSYSTGDYEAASYSDMLERLTRRSIGGRRYITVHNGTVIVLHMQENAKYTAQALDEMIPLWRAQGYDFARIDDYLGK